MPIDDDPIYEFPLTKAALKKRGIDVEYTGGYTVVKPDGAFYLFMKAPCESAREFSEAAKKYKEYCKGL